jgi:uncharacterized protein (DUF302 family)
MAHQALQTEDKVGTMLPCNVIVQEVGGRTEKRCRRRFNAKD